MDTDTLFCHKLASVTARSLDGVNAGHLSGQTGLTWSSAQIP